MIDVGMRGFTGMLGRLEPRVAGRGRLSEFTGSFIDSEVGAPIVLRFERIYLK